MGTKEKVQVFEAMKFSRDSSIKTQVNVVREMPLTIFLNGREIVTLLCMGEYLKGLAVGFLKSEGFLKEKRDIKSIQVDEKKCQVKVKTYSHAEMGIKPLRKRTITSGAGKGQTFHNVMEAFQLKRIESHLTITSRQTLKLMKRLGELSEVYKLTRGAHNTVLATPKQIILFRTDIGRHNCLDMINGECFLEEIPTNDKVLVTSGRITSEMLIKTGDMGVPIVISRSAPTTLALSLAQEIGITVIGSVRGGNIYVYTNPQRVILD